jgi:hypothetical protein
MTITSGRLAARAGRMAARLAAPASLIELRLVIINFSRLA